jgi:hypothetical protein
MGINSIPNNIRVICYLLFVSITIFCGCNRITSKSILNELNENEFNRAIRKDTLFKNYYDQIVFKRNQYILNKEDSLVFKDLTYNKYFRYLRYTSGKRWTKIGSTIQEEWEEIYGLTKLQIDSIDNYWQNKTRLFFLSKVMDIRIDNLSLRKSYANNSGTALELSIQIRNKENYNIQRLSFNVVYSLNPNNNPIRKNEDDIELSALKDLTICNTWNDSDKVINYSIEAKIDPILLSELLNLLKSDYKPIIQVSKINGFPFDYFVAINTEIEVPEPVLMHFKKGGYHDIYYDHIAKEILNTEYISKSQYVARKVLQLHQEFDELSFKFSTLGYDY